MNQTEHYKLSQWEKTDRILMEDFNRDNANIDAALKAGTDALAAYKSAEFLVGGTTKAVVDRLDLDVSGIDWARYCMLFLEISVPDTSVPDLYNCPGSAQQCVVGTSTYTGRVARLFSGGAYRGIIPVLYNPDSSFVSFLYGGSTISGRSSTTYRQTTAIYLYNIGSTIPANTSMRLWGVR